MSPPGPAAPGSRTAPRKARKADPQPSDATSNRCACRNQDDAVFLDFALMHPISIEVPNPAALADDHGDQFDASRAASGAAASAHAPPVMPVRSVNPMPSGTPPGRAQLHRGTPARPRPGRRRDFRGHRHRRTPAVTHLRSRGTPWRLSQAAEAGNGQGPARRSHPRFQVGGPYCGELGFCLAELLHARLQGAVRHCPAGAAPGGVARHRHVAVSHTMRRVSSRRASRRPVRSDCGPGVRPHDGSRLRSGG